ncbi:type II toxin-antitoxin system VapC family toxin [Patescibacteria group bacterium]|nr:type II toxin-antitoxin system VapC family toxin [Patescibacteria group bacterium]
MRVLFDTNILVYAYNTHSTFYEKARALYEMEDNICIAQQNLLELYSVITDKRRIEYPVIHEDALKVLKVYSVTDNFTVISPNSQTIGLLLLLLKQKKVNNAEIFDTYLVATMITNNVNTVYTADEKVFKKFSEINVINPFM